MQSAKVWKFSENSITHSSSSNSTHSNKSSREFSKHHVSFSFVKTVMRTFLWIFHPYVYIFEVKFLRKTATFIRVLLSKRLINFNYECTRLNSSHVTAMQHQLPFWIIRNSIPDENMRPRRRFDPGNWHIFNYRFILGEKNFNEMEFRFSAIPCIDFGK